MGSSAKKKRRPQASTINYLANGNQNVNMRVQRNSRLLYILIVIIMISVLNYLAFISSNGLSQLDFPSHLAPPDEPPIKKPPPPRRRFPAAVLSDENSLEELSTVEKARRVESRRENIVVSNKMDEKFSRMNPTKRISERIREPLMENTKKQVTAEIDNRVRDIVNNAHGDQKTLALLYPTGLFGGYRNQAMRFLAFVTHAFENNYTQIYLPSLLWATAIGNGESHQKISSWQPVPHDLLFDVDYWNSLGELPTLVSNLSYSDCWEYPAPDQSLKQNKSVSLLAKATLERGFLSPISDFARQVVLRNIVINPRKTDVLANVSNCTHPAAYGGGGGAGRLWYEYGDHQAKRLKENKDFPFNADAKVLRALRPKELWRNVAKECVERAGTKNYLALHARLELEMMNHRCGSDMERSLKKIFEMVEDTATNNLSSLNLTGVFLAVSRSGMEMKDKLFYNGDIKQIADENIRTLYQIVGKEKLKGSGLKGGLLPVFECGEQALKRYYENHPNSIDYGSTLESIINYYVATEASIFVGVSRSSYSTDIWTQRYYEGKGNENYEYTPEGIKKVANGGLPPPHSNCVKEPEQRNNPRRRRPKVNG